MAVRPLRCMPSDAALVNGQSMAAVGIVKANVAGLNFPATPFTLNVAQVQNSAFLDLSGYSNFVIYVAHSANSGASLNVQLVDPADGATIMTAIVAATTSSTGATITPLPFGVGGIAATRLPYFLVRLQLNGLVNGSISYISALHCSTT